MFNLKQSVYMNKTLNQSPSDCFPPQKKKKKKKKAESSAFLGHPNFLPPNPYRLRQGLRELSPNGDIEE